MYKIAIISSSVRKGRNSHRVALYLENYLKENNLAEAAILDLAAYNFPLFNERLKYLEAPSAEARDFADKIRSADGVIIVSPEYNSGYPASLKNVIDLLTDEWYHKPVAIATVSAGDLGGARVITSLQFVLWKMNAVTVPVIFMVSRVGDSFNEDGIPADITAMDKRAASFIKELLRFIEAETRMK